MAVVEQKSVDLSTLRAMNAEELIRWSFEEFGARAGIVTSFQNTGCVILDIAQRIAPGLRVLTIDTLRLHPETYAFIEQTEVRYGVQVERFKPAPGRVKQMVDNHGEYLFFDSKGKQEFCCQVRKVEPNQRALATLDLWITGLRRDQSEGRKETEKAAYTMQDGRQILKVSPLADWSEQHVRDYLKERAIPHNPLYDLGYTTIGCYICTTPTLPGEDMRAGRWRWFNSTHDDQKECGIHSSGSGI